MYLQVAAAWRTKRLLFGNGGRSTASLKAQHVENPLRAPSPVLPGETKSLPLRHCSRTQAQGSSFLWSLRRDISGQSHWEAVTWDFFGFGLQFSTLMKLLLLLASTRCIWGLVSFSR
ncbi:uncharacterized protein WM294_011119 [Sarcoramphus papa]